MVSLIYYILPNELPRSQTNGIDEIAAADTQNLTSMANQYVLCGCYILVCVCIKCYRGVTGFDMGIFLFIQNAIINSSQLIPTCLSNGTGYLVVIIISCNQYDNKMYG